MELSKAQVRAVERLHGGLAKRMADYFSEIQGCVIDTEVGFVDVTTFAEYIMSLANPSGSYIFNIHPWDGPATIDYHPNVYNAFLSHALGKEIKEPLADETREVMGKICVKNLAQLEAIWEPIEKISVTDATLETDPIQNTIVAPSHTVVLVGFKMDAPHHSGIISVAYPISTIESILPKLA